MYGAPIVPGSCGQIASGFAAVDATAQRAQQLEAAVKDIREQCIDAADLGSSSVYIQVIDDIFKRHGIN